jgi:PAS domain S-box-containing protein
VPASAIRTMDEGIFALDREGRLVYMNATAEALLGWRQRELCGRLMHAVIHDRQADSSPHAIEECPLRAVLARGTPVRVAHDVFSCKNGELLPVSYSAGPIVTDEGIQGLVVVFRDIRHRITARTARRGGNWGRGRWLSGGAPGVTPQAPRAQADAIARSCRQLNAPATQTHPTAAAGLGWTDRQVAVGQAAPCRVTECLRAWSRQTGRFLAGSGSRPWRWSSLVPHIAVGAPYRGADRCLLVRPGRAWVERLEGGDCPTFVAFARWLSAAPPAWSAGRRRARRAARAGDRGRLRRRAPALWVASPASRSATTSSLAC